MSGPQPRACAQCGHVQMEGEFCEQCGAQMPVPQVDAGVLHTPPVVAPPPPRPAQPLASDIPTVITSAANLGGLGSEPPPPPPHVAPPAAPAAQPSFAPPAQPPVAGPTAPPPPAPDAMPKPAPPPPAAPSPAPQPVAYPAHQPPPQPAPVYAPPQGGPYTVPGNPPRQDQYSGGAYPPVAPPPPNYPPPGGYGAPPPGPFGAGTSGSGFLSSLFDMSFHRFVTPKLIKVLFILGIVGIALWVLGMWIWGFSQGVGAGLVLFILAPIMGFVWILLARLWLEVVVVLFRIEEHTAIMARGEKKI